MYIHRTFTTQSFSTLVDAESGWCTSLPSSLHFCNPATRTSSPCSRKLSGTGGERESQKPIDGSVSTADWLQIIADTIAKVLPRTTWIKAFRAVGILDQQRVLSLKLAEKLGFDGALDLPSMLPSVEDAQCIFPSNMKLDVLSYLTWQPKAWRIKGSLPKPASSEPALPQPGPRLRRTLPASFHSAGRKIRTLD